MSREIKIYNQKKPIELFIITPEYQKTSKKLKKEVLLLLREWVEKELKLLTK